MTEFEATFAQRTLSILLEVDIEWRVWGVFPEANFPVTTTIGHTVSTVYVGLLRQLAVKLYRQLSLLFTNDEIVLEKHLVGYRYHISKTSIWDLIGRLRILKEEIDLMPLKLAYGGFKVPPWNSYSQQNSSANFCFTSSTHTGTMCVSLGRRIIKSSHEITNVLRAGRAGVGNGSVWTHQKVDIMLQIVGFIADW